MFSRKTYLALSLTTALVAASQPSDVHATQAESFGSKIVDAAEAGSQEDVLNLLQRGINPNERGQFGTSALLRAASSSNTQIAKILIDNGANANVSDLGGATALHISARKGDLAFAKFLLDNKANVNATDAQGNTPLMLAAINGNLAVVDALIKNGAKIDATNDSGETALHYATEEQAQPVVDALVAAGARKDIIDEEGFTPVEVAARKSDRLLIAKLDESNPNHVVIAMGRGFRSASAEQKQASVVKKPVHDDFYAAEQSRGEQLLASLAREDAIDFSEDSYLANPSDPDLNFFETPRFEPASGERQLASAQHSKNWLSGVKTALQDAGAFELASVQNFNEGTKYSLIELGSFKLRAFAEKRITELQQDHMDVLSDVQLAVFERGDGDNKEFYVNGGVFETLSEAENLCKKLTATGVRCNPVESAMITNEQFAKFSEPVKSEFSAPAIEQVDITKNTPPTLPAKAELKQQTPAPTATVQAAPIQESLPVPALPKLPQLSQVTAKTDVTPAMPENTVARTEDKKDDALSVNHPMAIKQPIPPAPVVKVAPKTVVKTIDPIAVAQEESSNQDESLTAMAGMSDKTEEETVDIQSIVDSIYEEKAEAEKTSPSPAKPVAFAEVKTTSPKAPAAITKTEPTQSVQPPAVVEKKVQALPKLSEVEAGNPAPKTAATSSSKEPLKIVFAEPKVSSSDTNKVQIAQYSAAKPTPAIANQSTNSVKLVNPTPAQPAAVTTKVIPKAMPETIQPTSTAITTSKPEAKQMATAEISKPTDKFVVSKPVRVNDTYSPVAAAPVFSDTYPQAAPVVSYTSPVFALNRRENRRVAKVDYFSTDTAAQGLYWKYRENGILNESVTVRATRDLMGKPYYSALIGEFRTSAEAQAFCNKVYKAEKLRCSIMDEIDYSKSPTYEGKGRSYKRHSSYSSNSLSPRRHSSR